MSVRAECLDEEEPPATPAQVVVGRVRQLLLHVLCFAPIALFPFGVAYKAYGHFFP